MATKNFEYDDEELALYSGELHKRHQGFTNFETWTLHLWLNEEASKKETVKICANADEFAASKQLKEMVEDGAPKLKESLYTDLMHAAMTNANWIELVHAFRKS